MFSKSKILICLTLLFLHNNFAIDLASKENFLVGSKEERCIKALDYYLTRPELETEYFRRLY